MLLSLLAFTLQTSWGQAPSGQMTFAFSSPNSAVYDLSNPGGYQFDQNIIGTGGTLTPLSIQGLVLTHSRTGRLSGNGLIQVAVGTDGTMVAAYYAANGQVSGGGDMNHPVKAQLNVRLTGKDTVAGVPNTSFSISVQYKFVVDPNMGNGTLVGTAKGHASFGKLFAGKIDSENVIVPLVPSVNGDGTWVAQLDVLALNRLGGSGTLVLPNGRTLPVNLNGSYLAASELSTLRATGYFDGENDGRSSTVQMKFFPGATGPDVLLSGKVLGQKVSQ